MDFKIFKPYDIRGIYPQEIDGGAAYLVARVYAAYLKEETGKNNLKIIVGRDARVSSPELHGGVVEGLTEEGVELVDMGLSTSPMHYFAINHLGADGGIMVTASHNPKEWNGLKLSREKAMPVMGEEMEGIKLKIKNEKLKKPTRRFTDKTDFQSVDLKKEYVEFLTRGVELKRKFKVVVDGGNGMAGLILPQALEKLGVEFIPLYLEPDGNFPNHEANPLKEETLAELKRKVVDEKADFGAAFDGDGDRVGFVDARGKKINGDFITAIFAGYFLRRAPGSAVVCPRPSSRAVAAVVAGGGGMNIATRTGHSFMKKAMRENNAVFGGEGSGHYYFRYFFHADAAILALITIFQLFDEEKKNLEALTSFFENKYFIGPAMSFSVENKEEVLAALEKKYADGKTDKIDGLSVEYENWWFNARPSGTEPVLRLKTEADSRKLLENKIEELVNLINSFSRR